jgi:hypothetical protein
MKRLLSCLFLLGGSLLFGCTNTDVPQDSGIASDARFLEAGGMICTDPNGDEDGDKVSNGDEGCLTGRDTDHDKIPDWQDFDSDNDGIPDATEVGHKDAQGNCAAGQPGGKAGKNKWPCDSDGDGFPDYIDVDSDNDGLLDKDEDASGDGLLGCCLINCNAPDAKWQKQYCILTADGCGPGQKCESGKCTPTIGFSCSSGETDPRLKDTFGDGKLDGERGTYICRDATEDKPKGRKVVQYRKNAAVKDPSSGKETGGDWQIAIEKTAKYADLTVADLNTKEAAAVIDHDTSDSEVAGFLLSKEATKDTVQEELTEILAALNKRIPGGTGTITSRASGIETHTHDKYDTIQGTILDLNLSGSSNISSIRNEIIGTILGKQMSQLGNLPGPYGSSGNEFVIRFVTVKRYEFQRDAQSKLILDAKGNPIDTGDKTKWRLLVMGAVAARANYQDPTRLTGFIADDLSNGTALAVASDKVGDACDVGMISSLPVADIIWVIDESGSMDDDRQNIVNNANNFFSRALSSGLDFRMGITGVCDSTYASNKPLIGKFCSKISTNSSDDGGTDRFLLPSEQAIFSSCINNPTGYEGGSEYGLDNSLEAVKKHLPRASNDVAKIRPEAKLVIIVATDEIPNEIDSVISYSDYDTCQLDATKQAALNSFIKPYMDLFSGITDPEGAAMYHVLGGVCSNTCGADMAHGYRELAQALGGQIGDVCQKDLGNTLQVIIDSIVGAASPVKLQYVPISASLAVAMDGVEVKRSRNNGFDYRSANNTLAFINVKYKKGSEVIASYKRWEGQVILQ